jgi:hypothetical protein
LHVGLNSLTLLRYGTEAQEQRWLAPRARGEKLACFGLTETGAGSDVAALRTTARREGDVYVLGGQKNGLDRRAVLRGAALDPRDVAREVGTRPSRRSTRRTRRCRCSARTATRPSSGSSGTSATRAPIIYDGTTQIHKLMEAEHALGYRGLNGRGGDVSRLCPRVTALARCTRARRGYSSPS